MALESIPVEILCQIFLLLEAADPIQHLEDARADAKSLISGGSTLSEEILISYLMLGWVNVTFVCQRWRNSALSNPSLWTRIPFVLGRKWAEAFIHRSQSKSVDILYGHPHLYQLIVPVTPWIEQLLLDRRTRMRSLTVYFDPTTRESYESDFFFTFVKHTFQQLEMLNLHRSWQAIGSSWLTAEQYPRLRALKLGLPFVQPHEFPWHDIGTLHLVDLDIQFFCHPITKPTFPEFLRALKQLVFLKTLRFSYHLNENQVHELDPLCICSSDVSKVDLDCLERLDLGSPSRTVYHILQHVKFPAPSKISLTLLPPFNDALFKSITIPVVSSSFTYEPYRQMFLSHNEVYGDSPWWLFAAHSTETRLHDAEIQLHLHDDGVMPSLDALIALGQKNMHALNICFWSGLLDESVTSKLLSLGALSCIRVSSGAGERPKDEDLKHASEALVALLQQLLASHADKSMPPPFPNLQILDLSLIGLTLAALDLPTPVLRPDLELRILPLFTRCLQGILKERRNAGVPIMRVYLAKKVEEALAGCAEGSLLLSETPEIQFVDEGPNDWYWYAFRHSNDESGSIPSYPYPYL